MDNLNNTPNKLALNRSYSFSGSPVSQKISVEKSYRNTDGEILIRRFSCEQIYDKTGKPSGKYSEFICGTEPFDQTSSNAASELNSFKTFFPKIELMMSHIDSNKKFPHSDNFSFHKHCPEQLDFEKSLVNRRQLKIEEYNECTPMEVDTSIEQDKSMSDVHNQNNTDSDESNEHRSKVPRLLIPPKQNAEQIKAQKSTSIKAVVIKLFKFAAMFLIPVTCALLLIQSNIFINEDSYMSDHLRVENITEAMEDLLFDQSEVVSKVKDTLKVPRDKHLLIFTGGIGVGKTYATNIISNNFQWKNNIQKIISPQFKNSYHEGKFLKNLVRNGYNLVVVDGLEMGDEKSVISFVKKLLMTDKKIIIILVFNVQEITLDFSDKIDLVSSSNNISNLFSEANMKHSLIIFNKLTKETVRKCIRYTMAKKGLIINENIIDNVLQNINYEYSGCKGVYSKVALLR